MKRKTWAWTLRRGPSTRGYPNWFFVFWWFIFIKKVFLNDKFKKILCKCNTYCRDFPLHFFFLKFGNLYISIICSKEQKPVQFRFIIVLTYSWISAPYSYSITKVCHQSFLFRSCIDSLHSKYMSLGIGFIRSTFPFLKFFLTWLREGEARCLTKSQAFNKSYLGLEQSIFLMEPQTSLWMKENLIILATPKSVVSPVSSSRCQNTHQEHNKQ